MTKYILCFILLFQSLSFADELEQKHQVNFSNVAATELLKFVSRIAEVNFIFDDKLLDFELSFFTGRPQTSSQILQGLINSLEKNGLTVSYDGTYYLVEKLVEGKKREEPLQASSPTPPTSPTPPVIEKDEFTFYKIKFHDGAEIATNIKQISVSINDPRLSQAIESLQWIKSTNSLMFRKNEELALLIQHLDQPMKQVFIEVLVLETDVHRALEFGLDWSGSGKYKDKLGIGFGNFAPVHGHNQAPLAKAMGQVDASHPPSGGMQFPLGRGFDLGIIGDIILHKGKTFLSLGSLVSALEMDDKTSIVLNQKIITQDNQVSEVFVGDNIPFPGAVVETIGSAQQTTANVEYRDIGVSLNIKPLLGDNDIVTLEISEEITEATNKHLTAKGMVSGIQTSKTNMVTRAHVPDQNFLCLSGMIRSKQKKEVSKVPCLGGMPLLGAAFSKNDNDREKRNILIFVRPQIVNNTEEIHHINTQQLDQFANPPTLESLNTHLRTPAAT
ncbi:MAG: Type 3 secretion system secretin [Chlamydiia bacterium]|nr:Type 3 secretion system secretin [Chlamydiia bacterium]